MVCVSVGLMLLSVAAAVSATRDAREATRMRLRASQLLLEARRHRKVR